MFRRQSSLDAMLEFKPLSQQFDTGTGYGLGLMLDTLQIGVQGGACGGLRDCNCSWSPGSQQGCVLKTPKVGHPGADYGSGFPLVGFLPSFGVSLAVASNTGEEQMGMNSTLGLIENQQFLGSAFCELLQLAIHLARPAAPLVACGPPGP